MPLRDPRKNPSRLEIANREHAKFLKRMGISPPSRSRKMLGKGVCTIPDYSTQSPHIHASDIIPGGIASKRNVLTDHLWRRDSVETPEVVNASRDKARRAQPLYNKGGIQLATDGHDPTKDGRRRT